MTNTKIDKMSDHDLLTRLDQKVSDLQIAVKSLSDGTLSKIATLEKDKADVREVEMLQKTISEDIEDRIRKLEDKTANYLITLSLYSAGVALLIGLLLWHIFGH